MKTVYIAHPIGGDVPGNIKKVLQICLEVHRAGDIPVTPYIVALQYLDDAVPDDRKLGMEANLECLRRRYVDEVWLFGDCISTGMKIEVRLALELGILVVCKTEGTLKDFMRLFPQFAT